MVEARVATRVAEAVGKVRLLGPAGAGHTDAIVYDPPGYSPVFSTWEIDATQNHADLVVDAPSGAGLENATFVVHGYDAASLAELRLDGARLESDRDYFVSVRNDVNELWITLNGKLRGASDRLTF